MAQSEDAVLELQAKSPRAPLAAQEASVLDERHVEEGSILRLVVSQRVLGRLLARGAQRLTDGLPS